MWPLHSCDIAEYQFSMTERQTRPGDTQGSRLLLRTLLCRPRVLQVLSVSLTVHVFCYRFKSHTNKMSVAIIVIFVVFMVTPVEWNLAMFLDVRFCKPLRGI